MQFMILPEDLVSDEGNSSAIYELTPRSMRLKNAGIAETYRNQEMIDAEATAIEWQKHLNTAFGYENSHKSELARALYIKTLFILHNGIPDDNEKAEAGLLLLAADQNFLFMDGDDLYYSRNFNRSALKVRRQAANARGEEKAELQQRLVEHSVRTVFPDGDKSRATQARKEQLSELLHLVVRDAANRRISVRQWLYSSEHIGITEENQAYYEECYRAWPDGYYEAERELPSGNKLATFIRLLSDKASAWQIELLDFEKCRESFEHLFEGRMLISTQACNWMIWGLAEYISQEKTIRTHFPEEGSQYADSNRLVAEWPTFQNRYYMLKQLADGFREEIRTWWNDLDDNWTWGRIRRISNPVADKILLIVRCYYEQIGKPLPVSGYKDALIRQRIGWVLTRQEAEEQSGVRKPILLLTMILCCDRKISKPEPIKRHPKELTPDRRPRYRYAQILLLDALHDVFQLTDVQRAQSWNYFFAMEDKQILSHEEADFWRKKLCNDENDLARLMSLPTIGFQLYLFNCLASCLPAHSDRLYSESLQDQKKLPWCINCTHSGADAARASMPESALKDYRQSWGNPTISLRDRCETFLPMLNQLEKQGSGVICPDLSHGVKLAIAENCAQQLLREQAYAKLCEWTKKLYGFNAAVFC